MKAIIIIGVQLVLWIGSANLIIDAVNPHDWFAIVIYGATGIFWGAVATTVAKAWKVI